MIAQQGDAVQMIDGRVRINDKPLSDDYVPTEFRSHDDWGPQVVPVGYNFVLGDHRNDSSDSRHWGYVPRRYIIGTIVARFGGTQRSVAFAFNSGKLPSLEILISAHPNRLNIEDATRKTKTVRGRETEPRQKLQQGRRWGAQKLRTTEPTNQTNQ